MEQAVMEIILQANSTHKFHINFLIIPTAPVKFTVFSYSFTQEKMYHVP